MELLHLLILQEAAKEGEAFTPCARAMQVGAWAHLAATGQEVGELLGGRGQPLVLGAGGCCWHSQPMVCSLLLLWILVGMALMVWSPNLSLGRSSAQGKSCRQQKPAACWERWAAAWPQHPAERGAGRMGLIITPAHLHCGNSYECHWHICSEREK